MPTAARIADEEERRAWADYAATLEGLEGAEYDRAEQEAWDLLQETLDDLRDASTLRRPPVG